MNATPPHALKLRWLALASLLPLSVMLAAMVLKPLWRDEYWSLFFSEPALDLTTLVQTRMLEEVHPPLYYLALHAWRSVLPNDPIIARLLAVPIVLAGAAAIWLLGKNKRETLIFLLFSLGSYWVIYFAAEVRPYLLLYVSCALSVFVLARLTEGGGVGGAWLLYPLWTFLGVAIGLTHYFGGIWFAAAGLCAGVAELIAKRPGRFIAIGVATTVALAPAAVWAYYSAQALGSGMLPPASEFAPELMHTLNQFLRGLVVKTFGSNPLILLAGFGGLMAAFSFKQRLTSILAFAALLTVLIAFAVHLAGVHWIKERAFIVIMPALIFVFARRIADVRIEDGIGARFASLIPVATLIMPFLFIPEYFKDRERLGDLQRYARSHAAACVGQPLLIHYRPSPHDGFQPMVARWVFRSADGDQLFQLIEAAPGAALPAPDSACPIRAAALLLEKGGGESRDLAYREFARAGLDTGRLQERAFGKGRSLLLIDEATPGGN